MGRSIRTSQYRLTRWARNDKPAGIELYDHHSDPQENINIADKPENARLVKQLTEQLKAGWRNAIPAKEK